MPPKKKTQKQAEEAPLQQPSKANDKSQLTKPQEKKETDKAQRKVPTNVVQSHPDTHLADPKEGLDNKQLQTKKNQEHKLEQPKSSEASHKVSFESIEKLTEKEKLELRKLRFGGGITTTATVEQAEKIKEQRMKKFGGGALLQDQATLEKRREKFGNQPSIVNENQETIQKRKQKFGLVQVEDQEKMEERKKKFGNSQGDIVLDEEIKKSKAIKKHHSKFNQGHRKPHKNFFRR